MGDRWQIIKTPNGAQFLDYTGPLRGADGYVKKGSCCGRNITIEGRRVNWGSFIEFLNSHPQLNLKKGCLGTGGSKKEEVHAAWGAVKMPQVVIVAEPEVKPEPEVMDEPVSPEVIEPLKTDPEPPASPFDLQNLSELEIGLYNTLSPVEQELYQLLYKLGVPGQDAGAFADLLLILINGRVKSFSSQGNELSIELHEGIAQRKVLGRDLKAKLPERLVLNIDSEQKEITFVQGLIPLSYKIFFTDLEILTPLGASLHENGAKINGETTTALKLTNSEWVLTKTLPVRKIFRLFS